jgi:hypothetical protein
MIKRRSLVSNTDISVACSLGNASNDHKSLDSDNDQTPEAQAPSFNVGSPGVILPHKGGVFSEHNVYTRKYIT